MGRQENKMLCYIANNENVTLTSFIAEVYICSTENYLIAE